MKTLAVLVLSCAALLAQAPQRLVRAVGQGSVAIAPDQIKINVGVITQAPTAQGAGALNSTVSTAVQAALRKVLGTTGDLTTVSYSVTATYRYPTGLPPELTGYTVTNTVQAVSSNVAMAGMLIDAATQAGANNIGALQFGVKDDSIPRAMALTAAAQQARSHALAMVAGVNGRLGNPVTVQEGYSSSPLPLVRTTAGVDATPTTPVDIGTLTVSATVTVDFELL